MAFEIRFQCIVSYSAQTNTWKVNELPEKLILYVSIIPFKDNTMPITIINANYVHKWMTVA